jgi:hypothetical protein
MAASVPATAPRSRAARSPPQRAQVDVVRISVLLCSTLAYRARGRIAVQFLITAAISLEQSGQPLQFGGCQSGALYELHRRHFGQDASSVLVWQASAPAMNPTLPADYLRRMEQDDPDAFRSEVLGEFRSGVSTFFEPDTLADCVDVGVRERALASGVSYSASGDAASGSRKDAFAVAVAHAEGERAVLDACRAWRPPFNPSGVIAEAAALLRGYRVDEIEGDRYAPGFVAEGFRAHGIRYRASERDTSWFAMPAASFRATS